MTIRPFFAFTLGLFIWTASLTTLAAEGRQKVTISIKGMVCSFCAQGLEKTFRAQAGVTDVKVSLEKKTVVIETTTDARLDDDRLRILIEDSGFDFVKAEREAIPSN